MLDPNARRQVPLFACATLLSLAAALSATAVAAPAYQITDRWQLGGTGGWDYLTVESARHRLFLSRGDHVDVVDTTSGKVVGRIGPTAGVHGVALAPDLGRGFTSNGKSNSITEFNLETLAVLRDVPIAGENPDAILYEAGHHRLYVFNGRSRDALVLDAGTLAIVKKLPMPDKPEFAQDDGHGHVYVNIESEHGQLLRIDTATLAIDAVWDLPGCASPSGLALDRAHQRLFSVCDGKVMAVTDAATGRQVARVAIGEGPDAVEYDAAQGLVFSSNGEGTLTVVRQDSADRYHVLTQLPTQKGARTMALDPATRRVYLVTAAFGAAPAATEEQPHPRPAILPDSFTVLVAAPR